MVKAEAKFAGEKPPSDESTQVSYQVKMVNDKKNATESSEEVVMKFQDERQRRTPRTGVFVCLLILLMLVGFIVVYVIQKSTRDKTQKAGLNFGNDYIVVTDPPDLLNTSNAWHNNVSWETQEEFYTLSDAISQEDIIGLRPIFRKDLPRDYIAYWEAKINGKNGEKYVIISAARQTGDHRLAEEGRLPSPSDLLTDQARRNGYGCHRIYRLRPDGLMACEDTRTSKLVAATRDIDSDSWDIDWKNLDKQVNRALPGLKREWGKLAERVKKDPEWVRFQWLSMKTGEASTVTTPQRSLPTQTPTSLETEYNFQVEETDGGFKAELGLRPGDSVRIPLGEGFREVRIKFVGLREGDEKIARGWKKRWQKRLCRVLCDVCEVGEGYFDMTKVSKRFFKLTKMGDRFIKVKVDANEAFVRRYLEGHEIRFKVELRTRGTRVMVINYGIILRGSRHRRSFSDEYHAIPHEELLPRYRQHKHGQCMTGPGPVAWATIFGYYDNMVTRGHNSSYPSTTRLTGFSSPLPLTMGSSVENVTQQIFHKLRSHCSPHGRGITSPTHMARITKDFKNLGQKFKVVHRGNHEQEGSSWTEFIKDLLQKGYPVIVSKETKNLGEHHYVVATRIRQTAKYFSFCNRKTDACSPWTLRQESLLFVHEEDKPGKWESADTHFVAAVISKKQQSQGSG